MGNKGSKGARSMRPPVKSDMRGFKFNPAASGSGRDAVKSAPPAPSNNGQPNYSQGGGHAAAPPPAPASNDGEADCKIAILVLCVDLL